MILMSELEVHTTEVEGLRLSALLMRSTPSRSGMAGKPRPMLKKASKTTISWPYGAAIADPPIMLVCRG